MPSESLTRTELAAVVHAEAWRKGVLWWKLDPGQRKVYWRIRNSPRRRYVLKWSRRRGKSFLLCIIAIEDCLRPPTGRVVYAAPTFKDAAEFVLPIIEEICSDAPEDCRPKFNSANWHLEFPNGSYIALFGCDDKQKANRGRGPAAKRTITDEAGFNKVLGYVLKSVLRPQLLTTGGQELIGSTPSDEAGHEFTAICERAEAIGPDAYDHQTIYDNPRLTPEQIEEFIRQDAEDEGMTPEEYKQSDTFRREYLAEDVNDRRLTAVPEWAESAGKYLKVIQRPRFFDGYVSQDPGGVDPHFVTFGYHHFALNALVVERELVFRDGENTEEMAGAIKAVELELWGKASHDGTLRGVRDSGITLPPWLMIEAAKKDDAQPYLRVSDVDVNLINDLHTLHGLAFIPTEKTDKALHVNNLRIGIRRGQVYVNPGCVSLDRDLKTTIWKNEKRTEFIRKNGSHGDGVDCLSYKFRNVNWGHNPEPPGWKLNPEKHYVPEELQRPSDERTLEEAFSFGG